jgi:hypothetical protein
VCESDVVAVVAVVVVGETVVGPLTMVFAVCSSEVVAVVAVVWVGETVVGPATSVFTVLLVEPCQLYS